MMETKRGTFYKRAACLMVIVLILAFGVLQSMAADISLDEIKNQFRDVFIEGHQINQNAVVLNDFIINPDKVDPVNGYNVKVTFVETVAGYNNGLGYFTFDKDVTKDGNGDITTLSKSDIVEQHVIFKDVKAIDKGKTFEISHILKNRKVGFYIISPDGYFYSIKAFNEADKVSHAATFKTVIGANAFVSLGFEDKKYSDSDKDFNDVFFRIDVTGDDFEDVINHDDAQDNPNQTPTPTTVVPTPTATEVTSTPPTTSPTSTQTATKSPDKTPAPSAAATTANTTQEPTAVVSGSAITIVNNGTTNTSGNLPKTGENNPFLFVVAGLILVAMGIFIWIKFGRKNVSTGNFINFK